MCRLFGFRSILQSGVHSSLTHAENALGVQAQKHPDGWGVAYYVAGTPHVIKSSSAAYQDRLFQRVSGVVTSDTVIAHVRRATVGELNILNCHPFQHGRWVFAHNGTVAGFSEIRAELLARIGPGLSRYVLGDTDSEVVFHLFLSLIARQDNLHRPGLPIQTVADAMRGATAIVREAAVRHGLPDPSLTLLASDGTILVAARLGRELHRSIRKHRCPERDTCPSFQSACETLSPDRFVSHFIVSSEPLQGENIWEPVAEEQVIGCDQRMRAHAWPA